METGPANYVDPIIYIRVFFKHKLGIVLSGLFFLLLSGLLPIASYLLQSPPTVLNAIVTAGKIDNQPIVKMNDRIELIKKSPEIQSFLLGQLQTKDNRWTFYDRIPEKSLLLTINDTEQTASVMGKIKNKELNKILIETIVQYIIEEHQQLFIKNIQKIDERTANLTTKLSLLDVQNKSYQMALSGNIKQIEHLLTSLDEARGRAIPGYVSSRDTITVKITSLENEILATQQELKTLQRVKAESRPTSVAYLTTTLQNSFPLTKSLLLALAGALVGIIIGGILALLTEWWGLNKTRL